MNIKCNVYQCKFNKSTQCTQENIEINMFCDEYNIAGCSNFQESIEYQRSFYKIVAIPTIENYKYIIFSMSYLGVTDYLKSIIEDLKQEYNENGKVNILIDNLLAVSNDSNRYIEMVIDFDKMDIIYDSCKVYESPKNSELRKLSSNFFMNEPECIENSILNSIQKKMILKGIGI